MYRIFRISRTALVMFCVGYFTTITVNAADAIQLNANDTAVKEMKIVLDDVKLKAPTDTVVERGMLVSVDGKITGEDFGVPLVQATSVTATEAPPDTVAK